MSLSHCNAHYLQRHGVLYCGPTSPVTSTLKQEVTTARDLTAVRIHLGSLGQQQLYCLTVAVHRCFVQSGCITLCTTVLVTFIATAQ